jgi:hypothetical protein
MRSGWGKMLRLVNYTINSIGVNILMDLQLLQEDTVFFDKKTI